MKWSIVLIGVVLCFSGCAMQQPMMTEEYQARPELQESLFSSDAEVLSEEAVQRILTSRIELSENAKIAVMKFPSSREEQRLRYHWGRYYLQSEEYVLSQSQYYEALSTALIKCKRIAHVTLLPSLMIPENPTISVLREAAVRMQADLLLVYRTEGSAYEKYVFLGKDQAKAYGNAEAVLLDVRTGVIPFTATHTETYYARKGGDDLTNDDMLRRVEDEAIVAALGQVGVQLADFLDALP